MQRTPIDLSSIRAARSMRNGENRDSVSRNLGISPTLMDRISATYANVPDALLVGIERVLSDRERLRRLISELMHTQGAR